MVTKNEFIELMRREAARPKKKYVATVKMEADIDIEAVDEDHAMRIAHTHAWHLQDEQEVGILEDRGYVTEAEAVSVREVRPVFTALPQGAQTHLSLMTALNVQFYETNLPKFLRALADAFDHDRAVTERKLTAAQMTALACFLSSQSMK